jgi:hypothetical protein
VTPFQLLRFRIVEFWVVKFGAECDWIFNSSVVSVTLLHCYRLVFVVQDVYLPYLYRNMNFCSSVRIRIVILDYLLSDFLKRLFKYFRSSQLGVKIYNSINNSRFLFLGAVKLHSSWSCFFYSNNTFYETDFCLSSDNRNLSNSKSNWVSFCFHYILQRLKFLIVLCRQPKEENGQQQICDSV